jgi:DNA polymerase alpha-associated DNA helicase A
MDLRDFANKQIELIEAEKNADIESTFTLQSRYSPIQLQRMGLALCGLSVSGLRSGLGGKFCVDFERDLGDQLPAHSFRNGDIVSVRDETNDQSGVVYKVTDQVLTVAFSEEFKDTGSRQSV